MEKTKIMFNYERQLEKDFISSLQVITAMIPILKELTPKEDEIKKISDEVKSLKEDISTLNQATLLIANEKKLEMLREEVSGLEKKLEPKKSQKIILEAEVHTALIEVNNFWSYADRIKKFAKKNSIDKIVDLEKLSAEQLLAYGFVMGKIDITNYFPKDEKCKMIVTACNMCKSKNDLIAWIKREM